METDLIKLSETAGVDLVAIRDKYRNRKTAAVAAGPEGAPSDERSLPEAMKALDNYSICKRCQGLGVVTELYNHFRMEKNCPDCDGESITCRVPVIPGINDS